LKREDASFLNAWIFSLQIRLELAEVIKKLYSREKVLAKYKRTILLVILLSQSLARLFPSRQPQRLLSFEVADGGVVPSAEVSGQHLWK
jgi:hypothetical protein